MRHKNCLYVGRIKSNAIHLGKFQNRDFFAAHQRASKKRLILAQILHTDAPDFDEPVSGRSVRAV